MSTSTWSEVSAEPTRHTGHLKPTVPGGAHGLVEALLGPVDFFLLRTLFADSAVVPALGLLEEWLPFLPETAPIATIAWCVETLLPTSGLAKLLGLEKK